MQWWTTDASSRDNGESNIYCDTVSDSDTGADRDGDAESESRESVGE
jgi:hypothetical protein